MERGKEEIGLEDYSVTQTSLEQVCRCFKKHMTDKD
jgi:hypothetical protein